MAFFALFTTFRVKTVRAGAYDCPKDNQAYKRARSFDLRLIQALFLYVVVVSFILSALHIYSALAGYAKLQK